MPLPPPLAVAALRAPRAGPRPSPAPGEAPPERGAALARRVAEYLEENLARPVTLDELSAATGRSKYHLLRVFRQETGLPPHAWQMRARVLRARGLLDRGMAVARAALETGFADQAHLTRHFKRLLGVTPGRYARAGRAAVPG